MIKRINSNGMYITFFSFILTYLVLTHVNGDLLVADGDDWMNFKFSVVMLYLLILCMDGINLNLYKLTHINKFEISITMAIIFLFSIHIFIKPLSPYIVGTLFIAQVVYRIRNHSKMEEIGVHGTSFDIKHALNIKENSVIIRSSNKKYHVSIKTKKSNEISFDKIYLFYKNKKIKISMLEQIQIDFEKNILDFSDEELTLAEIYST